MLSIFPQLLFLGEFAPLILRLVLGAIFIAHGYEKYFKKFDETVDYPARFIVIAVSWLSLASGALLIVGFLTQLAAIMTAVMSLGLLWKVGFKKGLIGGWEFDLALLAMSLALIVLGPGFFSIDLPL